MGKSLVNFDTASVTREDWIRLAAFIDGEGCIQIIGSGPKKPRHLSLKLQICNTDIRLTDWLMAHFKGRVQRKIRPKPNCKDAYAWEAASAHAEVLIRQVRPFLLLKGQQADVALAFRRTFMRGHNRMRPMTNEEHSRRESLKDEMTILNRRGPPERYAVQ